MRWSTLVLSVTLFYSLSFVNAIPHDVHEHRRHRRQDPAGSSTLSGSTAPSPSLSSDPQGDSSPVVSSTPSPTPTPSSGLLLSSSSSDSVPPSTSQPSSGLPSSSIPDSSSSTLPQISSSSSVNTPSRTSSTTSSTITNPPDTQVSTSYRRFSSTLDIPTDTQSADGNVETGAGSGNSFLQNKAAMGSTFAIVGLVGAAIIVGAVFFLAKKIRQRQDEDDLDTYFEKLPANHSNNATNRGIGGGGNDYGLGPSATDLTAPANSQTYMSRDVHYGSTSQYPNQFANYDGLEYPPERGSVVDRPVSYVPGTAYAAAMSQRGQYHYEGQVEDPNSVPNHPFADPHNRRY